MGWSDRRVGGGIHSRRQGQELVLPLRISPTRSAAFLVGGLASRWSASIESSSQTCARFSAWSEHSCAQLNSWHFFLAVLAADRCYQCVACTDRACRVMVRPSS